MKMRKIAMAALALSATAALTALPVHTAQAADNTSCKLTYTLSGWSAIYKHAEGTGTVTCNNGQSSPVKITVVGGGLTAGKYRIDDGQGVISNVRDIREVYGDYGEGSAEAGAVKAARAQVMTKGNVSLALSGTGEGWGLGVSFGKFTIEPVR